MEKHHGEIIELTVRRNGYSISELSRTMKVNRRSFYNWFDQPKLKTELIFKIGVALRHDFSKEFPELFTAEEFKNAFDGRKSDFDTLAQHAEETAYWKDKYISLLEQYNVTLTQQKQYHNLSAARM